MILVPGLHFCLEVLDTLQKCRTLLLLNAHQLSFRMSTKHRIYTTSFASVYPLYVAKAEKKGRTKQEVDAIILWLTGYSQQELDALLEARRTSKRSSMRLPG